MSSEQRKTILLTQGEIRDFLDGDYSYCLPTDVFEPIITERRAVSIIPDGVAYAAQLLLTQAPTSIHWVNTDVRVEPNPEHDWQTHTYERQTLLGYNDHGGGSESAYKILLHDIRPGQTAPYVLFSPPLHTGKPSSLTFHHASFTFPTSKPVGAIDTDVPNPLKSASQAQALGRREYGYVLFGDATTPHRFIEQFQTMNFLFDHMPYDSDVFQSLRESQWACEAQRQSADSRTWPGNQFAEHVALLQA